MTKRHNSKPFHPRIRWQVAGKAVRHDNARLYGGKRFKHRHDLSTSWFRGGLTRSFGDAARFRPESQIDQPPVRADHQSQTGRNCECYHQTHRAQLPDLAALALKVKRVHGDSPDAPLGLGTLLERLIGTLQVHMKKEVLILFSAIRPGGGPGTENPIAVMLADHDDHQTEVVEIRRLTHDLTLPESACRSWTALYAGLDHFLYDLDTHIRLENDVLFPQFEPAA